MEEKNWKYSTTNELYNPEPSSVPTQELSPGMRTGRIGLAALKGTIGLPGAIVDLPVQAANLLYHTATGKDIPIPQNILSESLGIPSPTSVGRLAERVGERHLPPQTQEQLFGQRAGSQSFAEEVAEVAPAFIAGSGVTKIPDLLRAGGKALAATTAKKGVEQFKPITGRVGPLLENTAFMLGAHAFEPGLSPKRIEEKIKPAYEEFEKTAPSEQMAVGNTHKKLFDIDAELRPTFEDSDVIRRKLGEVERSFSDGKLTFEEGKNIITDLNEMADRLTPTGQHYISELKKAIELDMKTANPDLYNKFSDARDLYRGWKKYEKASEFIRTNDSLSKIIAKSAAAKLASSMINNLGGYAYLYPGQAAAKRLGGELSAFKKLLEDNPIAKRHYTATLGNAAKGYIPGVANNLTKLGKEAEKAGIKAPQKEDIRKEDGKTWLYSTI